MCTVPLILDRIFKNLTLAKKGENFRRLSEFYYNYKLRWAGWSLNSSLLDLILFSKLKTMLS